MRVTPTVLLDSWVLQPIEGMTYLGTDFETHAEWQGSIEESAATDFVARKVHTTVLNEVQGTNWNAIKCKERLGSHPVVGRLDMYRTKVLLYRTMVLMARLTKVRR